MSCKNVHIHLLSKKASHVRKEVCKKNSPLCLDQQNSPLLLFVTGKILVFLIAKHLKIFLIKPYELLNNFWVFKRELVKRCNATACH